MKRRFQYCKGISLAFAAVSFALAMHPDLVIADSYQSNPHIEAERTLEGNSKNASQLIDYLFKRANFLLTQATDQRITYTGPCNASVRSSTGQVIDCENSCGRPVCYLFTYSDGRQVEQCFCDPDNQCSC